MGDAPSRIHEGSDGGEDAGARHALDEFAEAELRQLLPAAHLERVKRGKRRERRELGVPCEDDTKPHKETESTKGSGPH